MKAFVWYMLLAWSGTSPDAAKIKANIEKDMKDRIRRNTHGTVKYETISMSELQARSIPFYCTTSGAELADSIYEESETRHVATFNTIVALKNSNGLGTGIDIDDTTKRLQAIEKEYKKALHSYYLKAASVYAILPDTEYHVEIVYQLSGKNIDGSIKQLIDSVEYNVNAKSSAFDRQDEFITKMKFLPSGCDHNGWLMLEYRDKENWDAPPPPPPSPPDFH